MAERPDRAPLRRFGELGELTRAAVDDFIAVANEARRARSLCHVALSGGSTPKRLFEELSRAGRQALPWDAVHLWWGDERTVAPDHPDSNYGMARALLIEPLALDLTRVHRIAGELADHDAAARSYEDALVAELGAPPVFDLVYLGMGPDGHTASLFPGSGGLDETRRWVIANRVTSPLVHGTATRITLTAPAINAARRIRFLVAGADKAASLAQVLEGPRDPHRYPAQLIRRDGDVVWLVDEAAASQLRGAP